MNDFKNQKSIEIAIKIAIISFMLYWTYVILKPFMGIVIWAIIIAVAVDPLISLGERKLGVSRIILSLVFSCVVILTILAPIIGVALSFHNSAHDIVSQIRDGTFAITPPNQKIADIPFIGQQIYDVWMQASTNLNDFMASHKEEATHYTKTALTYVGNGVFAVLSFMGSVAIAGIFISKNVSSGRFATAVASRIAGTKGAEWLKLSILTIRSVMKGVVGIALIQSVVGYIGFIVVGLPFSAIWALVVLIVAIAQIPLLIITIPMIIYVFSVYSPTTAALFAIFAIALGLSDNVLRPLLLGRGVDVPMVIILIGAIGGMLAWGILGLFIGSVLLAVMYKLIMAWLKYEIDEN